jgi:hypothetical protein
MAYTSFSTHAPTGESQKFVVSPNPYSDKGRNIGYPTRFSTYVNKISELDGAQTVTENRTVDELIGNRLYLWHRPMVAADGTPLTITVQGGGSPLLDTSATNAKSAYIVFTALPTSDFSVTYIAVPDYLNAWHLNTLQDDIMEMQKNLGVSTLTGAPGLRNLAFASFDLPNDANYSGLAQRAVYLSHLAQNIVIGSTNDPSLAGSLGTNHRIQLGRSTDAVVVDATGFHVTQSNGLLTSSITLGSRTGDFITYKGHLSGEGPITIGGPAWTNIGGTDWASRGYSGTVFSSGLTGSFYSGAMLRVHGDVAVNGQLRANGALTIVTSTGTTSVVLGDWTIQDELYVYGVSYLNGPTEATTVNIHNNLNLDGNLIMTNTVGADGGQGLVDNLDCSEVAHSYKTIARKRLNYSVVDGSHITYQYGPKLDTYAPHYALTRSGLVGEIIALTGDVNAPAGPSGAHPNVIQLNVHWPVTSGTCGPLTGVFQSLGKTSGSWSGVWDPGFMDPGSAWIKIVQGSAKGFTAPIYGYRIEEVLGKNVPQVAGQAPQGTVIKKINVFCPELVDPRPSTSDVALIYNPSTIAYNFISAAGGAVPTFQVSGSEDFPFKVAFEDEVRIMKSTTASLSLANALDKSINGMTANTVRTGIAYIFASANNTDPENPPTFKARPVPYRMPNETVIGEVVASLDTAGTNWSILDTVSYRPGGIYDSSWLPIVSGCLPNQHSGRFVPMLSYTGMDTKFRTAPVLYFQHHLGPDIDLYSINAQLYLAAPHTGNPANPYLSGYLAKYNQTHTNLFSFQGQDSRNVGFVNKAVLDNQNGKTHFNGMFTRIELSAPTYRYDSPGNYSNYNQPGSYNFNSQRAASICYLDGKIIGLQLLPGLVDAIGTGIWNSNAQVGQNSDLEYTLGTKRQFEYLRLVIRRDV